MSKSNGQVMVAKGSAPALTMVESQETPIRTDGRSDGVIELSMPNLLPTDNAAEVFDVPVFRVRIPVRIDHLHIRSVDNGFIVELPRAGRQGTWGPDGSQHVFSGENAKSEMLSFVAHVMGQVTYQYREVEGQTYERIRKQQTGARDASGVEGKVAAEASLDCEIDL